VAPKKNETRKRPASEKEDVVDSEKQQPPPTKRRRQTASSTPKRAGSKAKAPAKKAAAKKAVVKSAAKKKTKDASDSESSDSDSSDSESVSSSSDSDSEMTEVPVAKPSAKAPAPKKAAPKAVVTNNVKDAVEEKTSAPTGEMRPPTPAADIINQPRRRLTDSAIDELVPLILRNERPSASGSAGGEDDGKVVVISPLKLQAVLSRFAHRRAGVTSENVHKLLGLTREKIEKAEVIAVVLHGPHTESERIARQKYEGERTDNYHWSVACWFRSLGSEVFHYDSRYPLNDKRCAEVLGVLRSLGVFPTAVSSYVLPDFFPQQEHEWECGYEVLIALTIIASSPTPSPVSEADVDTSYGPFFSTLNAAGGADAIFIKRMRELLAREKYAF
jgi:hypothetical protein